MDLVLVEKYSCIRVERNECVALVTIDRPEVLNAINVTAGRELREAFGWADAERSIRVIVVTGTGRAFSAGADLTDLAREGGRPLATDEQQTVPGASIELSERLLATPTIAAVNGLAYGGGFEMALACDLIVAADTARFALAEVKRGLMAAGGGVLRLARQLPTKVAMEVLLTGEPIEAARAAEFGLVNRVVPVDDVLTESFRLAEIIAANAPLAIAATKQLAYRGTDVPLYQGPNAWDVGRTMAAALMASADAREGARAFLEKRPPHWSGH